LPTDRRTIAAKKLFRRVLAKDMPFGLIDLPQIYPNPLFRKKILIMGPF